MYELVIVIPIIRTDFVEKSLETLYKNTDPGLVKVIVIDQSMECMYEKVKKYNVHYVKPSRNLGFAKAANEGIAIAKRQGVQYIGVLNDDTEFMHPSWWAGIKEQFTEDNTILCVNPESPRVPLWGYGRKHDEYVDIIDYKEQYSDEDLAYLKAGNYESLDQKYTKEQIPDAFPRQKRGVIDAIAMWFPIFKSEFFDRVGYFDERFYPGGGEDYDLNARAYRKNYRLVSTMKSWVWHWWGQSKDKASELPEGLNIFDKDLRWNDNNYLWPPELNNGQGMDPWGYYKDKDGQRKPYNRVEEVAVKPL